MNDELNGIKLESESKSAILGAIEILKTLELEYDKMICKFLEDTNDMKSNILNNFESINIKQLLIE